jgi:hypothetical protein
LHDPARFAAARILFTLVEALIFVLAPSGLASPQRGAPPPALRAPM